MQYALYIRSSVSLSVCVRTQHSYLLMLLYTPHSHPMAAPWSILFVECLPLSICQCYDLRDYHQHMHACITILHAVLSMIMHTCRGHHVMQWIYRSSWHALWNIIMRVKHDTHDHLCNICSISCSYTSFHVMDSSLMAFDVMHTMESFMHDSSWACECVRICAYLPARSFAEFLYYRYPRSTCSHLLDRKKLCHALHRSRWLIPCLHLRS